MPILKSSFKPAWWLPNGHFQTLWSLFFRIKPKIELNFEKLELEDNDFLELAWTKNDAKNIVLITHGIVGSYDSVYIKGILKALIKNNLKAVVMNFRGSGNETNRLPRSYNAGDSNDLYQTIKFIRKKEPKSNLFLLGYSLGANVLLKLLGEKNNLPVKAAIAVSPPFDLNKSSLMMARGFSKIYRSYITKRLKDYIKKKNNLNLDLSRLNKIKTIKEFDDYITAPLNGFRNVEDYYSKTSCNNFIKNIRVQTLIIHSKDDPLIHPDSIPNEKNLSSKVTLEISQKGGHVGFISGNALFFPIYWSEKRISEYLSSLL